MKPKPTPGGLSILALLLLAGAARLPAQEAPAASTAPSPAPGAAAVPAPRVLSARTVPLPDGRTLTIQRVSSLPRPVAAPPPPPAAAAPRAQRPPLLAAQEHRLLFLYVTRFADDLSYLTWSPAEGGAPFGAWSSADLDALRMVPEVVVSPANIRWTIFPLLIYRQEHRPLPGPLALPQLPADGPGFQIVQGHAADAANIAPVAALHQLYKEHGPALKLEWQQREAQHLAAEAARAPQDVVIRYREARPIRRNGGAR